MTDLVQGVQKSTILPTENTNQKAEELGYNIAGLTFIHSGIVGPTVRGYVRVPLFGMATIDKGPIVLNKDDLET